MITRWTKVYGPCTIFLELFSTRVEFSTKIHFSAEQARFIREKGLEHTLTDFIERLCARKSFGTFRVEPLRISFTELERSQVSGVVILIRLNFPSNPDEASEMRYELARRVLVDLFKDIRYEVSTRTGLPFANRSTSPRRSLGKSGKSITSLEKERDRAQRDLERLRRLIEFGNSGGSGSKKRKGSD